MPCDIFKGENSFFQVVCMTGFQKESVPNPLRWRGLGWREGRNVSGSCPVSQGLSLQSRSVCHFLNETGAVCPFSSARF